MQIANPLEMNDWEIKKFFKIVLAIQLAIWGLIGLDVVGLQIPILRQVVGFVYLTFIPGFIILRILKLHKLSNIGTLLYTVGLSIAFLMFTGLFMNTLYPYLGISKPISFFPLIITLTIAIIVLCILAYKRDRDFSSPTYLNTKGLLFPPTLFLILLPFFAISGTCLVNFYSNNILLMLLIPVIALIALLVGFDKFISKNLYPLTVFVIAISLLYHQSLISMYLTGWDIHVEYYFHKLVMMNSHWDSTIPGNSNAMLSITILPAIYSHILNMEGTWIFKIIYPLFFSFLPIGLYHIYQKQTDEKIAFLSVFYFMSIYTFFTEMLALAKQQIAEIFFMLIILVMISKRGKLKSRILLIIFGTGLITSHYGLSYLFLFFGLAGYIFMRYILRYKSTTYHPNFLVLYMILTLSWYINLTSGSVFEVIVRIGSYIYNTMLTEIFTSIAITLAVNVSPSVSGQILRVLYLTSQFFILIGFLKVLLRQKEFKFYKEYFAFSVISFGILGASIFTSFTGMNIHRLFHVVSIILAPFCVIGGIAVFKMLAKVAKVSWTSRCVRVR